MQHGAATFETDASTVPQPEDVRAQLDRILSSTHFLASARRRAFLKFVVDETLSGRADRLKGFSIAVAVFGRNESFDPQADPVVRLEAGRLRRDLDSYYVGAGANDPVRISVPKGTYVPQFVVADRSSTRVAQGHHDKDTLIAGVDGPNEPKPPEVGERETARSLRRPVLAFALALIAIIAAFGGWLLYNRSDDATATVGVREPAVVIMPFMVSSPGEDARYFAQGLSQELINNLFRFPGFRLYAMPADAERKLVGGAADIGRDLGATYVVHGSVRTDADEIRVLTQVTNAKTGQVIWSRTYTNPSEPQALIKAQGDLASEIATAIGQPYGVVTSDIRRATPSVSNMQSYVCVLRAYAFRRNFAREDLAPTLRCLEQAVQRDPDYSDAWAMLGWVHVDAGRLGYSGDANRQSDYGKALQATSRAAALQPDSPLALKALAAANYYLGRYDESERITRQALVLNPNDPEVLAQLGWRLAARGNFDEGIPLLKRAIARTLNPPGWYYNLVAIDLYLKGDYRQMLEVTQKSLPDGSGFSTLLLAIANAELGNDREAQKALEQMSQFEPVARDPAGYMRRHGATDRIVHAVMAGLQKAQRPTVQE